MNAAHLHIILVHIPVVMLPLGAVLLGLGMWRENITLRGTGYSFFVVAAIVTVAAFLLGDGAEEIVEHLTGVAKSAVEAHEEAAEVALWFTIALGIASLGMLVIPTQSDSVATKAPRLVVIFALITTGVLGYSAQLGGRIRHPEAFEQTAISDSRDGDHAEKDLAGRRESDD